MLYFYIKALHIIFVVTWFSGLFYIVRLYIYATEAEERAEPERSILLKQFGIMKKRLWYGITWPSAILTLIFGAWIWQLYGSLPAWLQVKLIFVFAVFLYHLSLHVIFKQQSAGIYKYSSQKLRFWNEVATILLVAIVMLATVKSMMSAFWGIAGLIFFSALLIISIKVYKTIRNSSKN